MLKIRRRIPVRFLSMVRLKSATTRQKTPSALLSSAGRDGSLPIHPRVRKRVQSSIRWWKRQKSTACGWMTICFICSVYYLSARSGTRTLRLMICSLGQKKWSRGSRQCECRKPRLFYIGGLLSGYASKMSAKDFLTFLCAFHISLNIILTQRLLFCIIMSDGLENMPLVITERKQ